MPYIRVPKLSGSHPLVLDTAVQVKLRWQLNGIQCLNVLGGRVAGGWSNNQAHANDLADAVSAAFASTGLNDLMATTTTLVGVGVRDLRAPHLVEYEANSIALPGTGTGQPLPNALAAVVTLRTAFAGKSYRGRIYYSGADEDQNDSTGMIGTTLSSTLVTFTTAIQTAMAAEGITLAVLSMPRYANLPPPGDVETWPGAVTDVTGISMNDRIWDSQRRRRT